MEKSDTQITKGSYKIRSLNGSIRVRARSFGTITRRSLRHNLLKNPNGKVDQKGSLQRTALHEASVLGLENFVYLLLQSGADPNATDVCEHAPLGLVAQAGHFNVDCPCGQASHVPVGFEGWSTSVIKDMVFCEVITINWLKHISAQVVRIMLDYVDHVTLCSKLKTVLVEHNQWPEICQMEENARNLKHLCRLKIRDCLGRLRLRAPVFISFLPLPASLKDYIHFKEYDVYSRGSMTEEE